MEGEATERSMRKVNKYMRIRMVNLYRSGMTQKQIAIELGFHRSTVQHYVGKAIKEGRVRLNEPNTQRTTPIKPHDYSGASEYTLHFKGAEFEDTRFKELRELGAKHPFRYRM
jgi:transposase-like protein